MTNVIAIPVPFSSDQHAMRRFVISCILAGALLRLALSAVSAGTNDANIWMGIADHVSQVGVLEAYRTDPLMNHPPLAVLWARLSLAVGGDTWFTFVMKLPAIAGDLLSIWLIAKIWARRGDFSKAKAAAICMMLNPIAILISGYHCNTDNLYAFLCLLTMYFIDGGGRFFLAGLALAAAINVKLIPVLLILPAMSFCRTWRDWLKLVAGLSIGVIPFLPLVFGAYQAMHDNMLKYVPPVSPWGIAYILSDLFTHKRFEATAYEAMKQYLWFGRWLILAGLAAISGTSILIRRWNPYELGVIVFAMFLVLAPGFGNQYLVILVPLLLTVSVSRAWVYSILAGLFSLLMYWAYLSSVMYRGTLPTYEKPGIFSIPWLTVFPQNGPAPGATIGLLAWWVLAATAVWLLARKRDRQPAP
ncbi:MAG TPA: hypothetical protein VHD56_11895 [Tepidisphaeraceae bacterium]|nr:hypothetical protein [Tepidisphaeraceae bacterium]